MERAAQRALSTDVWDNMSDSVRNSFQRQALVIGNLTWMYVYLAAQVLSLVASLLAVYHLRKLGGDMFRSTVRFVITSFLWFSTLNALVGTVLYTVFSIQFRQYLDVVTKVVNEYYANSGSGSLDTAEVIKLLRNDTDSAVATYVADLLTENTPLSTPLTVLLVTGNALFVLNGYWIFLVARELFKLALTTFDRGYDNERRTIWVYVVGAVILCLLYLAWALPIVVSKSGYTNSLSVVLIAQNSLMIFFVVYSHVVLVILRCKGRKDEHIHGKVSPSPLYERLQRLMIACTMCALPYAVLQLLLLTLSSDEVNKIPDWFVGVISTLYYTSGAVQALLMAGSQSCFMRLLNPIAPVHVKQSAQWKRMQFLRRNESAFGSDYTTAPTLPIFVHTDIESSSALWAQASEIVMEEAQDMHDDILRYALPKFNGYEITTVGDSFQLAFHTIEDAVGYCIEVQLRLLHGKWPTELEGILPSTKTEWIMDGFKPQLMFKGIRVRMGIHDANEEEEGKLVMQMHSVTGKVVYIGSSEFIAREVGDVGFGGQIITSGRIARWLEKNEDQIGVPFLLNYLETLAVEQLDLDVDVFEITPKILEGRRKLFQQRLSVGTESIEIIVGEEYDGCETSMHDFRAYYHDHDTPRRLTAL